MKKIVTMRKNGTRRVQIKCDDKSLTDQSYAKACDINLIVARYHKTGILPQSSNNMKYGDFSEVPTLEQSFEAVHAAKEAFYQLPADLRKLLDNDPSKLEVWLSDNNNKDLALKYGLLEEKAQEKQESSDSSSKGGQNESTENSTTVSASETTA